MNCSATNNSACATELNRGQAEINRDQRRSVYLSQFSCRLCRIIDEVRDAAESGCGSKPRWPAKRRTMFGRGPRWYTLARLDGNPRSRPIGRPDACREPLAPKTPFWRSPQVLDPVVRVGSGLPNPKSDVCGPDTHAFLTQCRQTLGDLSGSPCPEIGFVGLRSRTRKEGEPIRFQVASGRIQVVPTPPKG
jgi:hypothetical protein